MPRLLPALATLLASSMTLAPAALAHEHHHPAPQPSATPSASPMDMQMPMEQTQPAPSMAPMPGMEGMPGMPGMEHEQMSMDPLMMRASTLGSGTSLIPGASPMRMWSLHAGDWLWMFHGNAEIGFNRQGGLRGASTWTAENWQMAMGTRPLGPGLLDLFAMTSLEGLTLPPGGTPQLFQTGETYQGKPLIDRQHPHDLFMELAARYTWNLSDKTSLFLYAAPVGEPALGPTAFMHRPSAADNPWAPLGHHLQDSTHISYGVGTLGVRLSAFQLEGSLFNGREPDENRFNFDLGPLDSWSTRLSWMPDAHWVTQVSYGRLHNPEVLEPGDVNRTTASLTHVMDVPVGVWSSSLIWGQNQDVQQGLWLQGYGVESQLDAGANHVYTRFELLDKQGLQGLQDASVHRVGALTLGGVRDLGLSDTFNLGLGADVTVYSMDQELHTLYGFNPLSVRVYLRLQPPMMHP